LIDLLIECVQSAFLLLSLLRKINQKSQASFAVGFEVLALVLTVQCATARLASHTLLMSLKHLSHQHCQAAQVLRCFNAM